MSFAKLIITYLLTLILFLTIDLFWLGFFARGFYQQHLGHLMGDPNWIAAVAFYLMFVGGILNFVIIPSFEKKSLSYAMVYGTLFGFFTYATYDLTNLATLKDWPKIVVVVDIVWGMALTGAVSVFGFYVARWLGRLDSRSAV